MLDSIITVLKSKECYQCCSKKTYKNAAKTINNLYNRSSLNKHFTEFKSRHLHVPKMILWQYLFASVVTCIALIEVPLLTVCKDHNYLLYIIKTCVQ